MRKVLSQEIHPTGNLFPEREESLFAFLGTSGLLFHSKLIPPLSALNEFLIQGINDMGMSGGAVWKPFEIDEAEYFELRAYANTEWQRSQPEFIEDVTPLDVRTLSQWRAWRMHVECGCNYQKLAPVMERYDALNKAIDEAIESGNDSLAEQLQDEKSPVLEELARLLKNE